MDITDATWTRQELDDLRTRLENTQLELRLRVETYRPPAPETGDIADQADWSSRVELDALTLERDRLLLEQTDHVLDLLDRGQYGRCRVCDSAIPRERLLAHPQATMCLTCAHAETSTAR